MLIPNQILALQRGSALNWADDGVQPITRGRFSCTVILTFLFSLPSPTLSPCPHAHISLAKPLGRSAQGSRIKRQEERFIHVVSLLSILQRL